MVTFSRSGIDQRTFATSPENTTFVEATASPSTLRIEIAATGEAGRFPALETSMRTAITFFDG